MRKYWSNSIEKFVDTVHWFSRNFLQIFHNPLSATELRTRANFKINHWIRLTPGLWGYGQSDNLLWHFLFFLDWQTFSSLPKKLFLSLLNHLDKRRLKSKCPVLHHFLWNKNSFVENKTSIHQNQFQSLTSL